MIQWILGRAGTGKTHLMMEQMKRDWQEKKYEKLILIVPEQFTLQAERDLIEKLHLPGIMEIEVLSITRLAHNILHEVGGITRIHINEQGKNMILRKIIDQGEKNLNIYKQASKQEGFIKMCNDLLCEMKQCDIFPVDLQKRLTDIQEDSILHKKLKDIHYIYEIFDDYLKDKYIDTEDYLNLLIEKMDQSKMLKKCAIWMDGFQSFTPQTYRVLEKIIQNVEKVTIGLTMDLKGSKDEELFEVTQNTYENIKTLGMQNGIVQKITHMGTKNDMYEQKSDEILHIEKNLYAYPYTRCYENIEHIKIFAGTNAYTEIENVAAKIYELVRDRGYKWFDIGVVCNDIDKYGSIIERVFDEYEIPYFLDRKRTIMHNPMIECILASLACIHRGYRYEDVFQVMKTGLTPIDVDEYEKLENYVLAYGIKGKQWKKPLEKGMDRLDQETIDELNENRHTFIKPLQSLEEKIKGKKTVKQISRALYEYLNEIGVYEKLQQWIKNLRNEGAYEYASENTQIFNLIMEILDQLVEIIGDQKIDLKEYMHMLQSGFESLEVGIIPTTLDQVLVGNIQRSKSHDLKALFIVGVNDGILPSRPIEDGILSDDERMKMKENKISLRMDSKRRSEEEKFMIYTTMTKPETFLWISYAMADGDGKAMRPSILVERIKKMFPKLKVESDLDLDETIKKRMIVTPQSTFKYLIEQIRQSVDGKDIDSIWWDAYLWYDQEEKWKNQQDRVVEGFFHTNQQSYIEKKWVKPLYSVPIRSSISRLEQFAKCPFSHFIKYGLKLKDRKVFEVKAPDIGEIFHESMESFTQKLKERKIEWRNLDEKLSHQIIDEVMDDFSKDYKNGLLMSTSRYKYLLTRLKRISKRSIWILTQHIQKSAFNPAAYEVEFGKNGTYPPIEIELASGEKIYLEGRIDRVDLLEEDEEYVKIIDYKSGNKDFKLSDVYYGLELQLMIYLDAVLKNNNGKSKKPAGIFYFKIDDPMIKSEEKIIEVIEKEIRKKMKMKGLVLKDTHVVKKIDKDISGYSDIIPVGLNKDGKFYSKSSALDYESFMEVIEYVRKLTIEMTYEMMKGNIKILPCKDTNKTSCDYCIYQDICQFDTSLDQNEYQVIKKLSDEEVLRRINEGKDPITIQKNHKLEEKEE